jgi:hypothetical protein
MQNYIKEYQYEFEFGCFDKNDTFFKRFSNNFLYAASNTPSNQVICKLMFGDKVELFKYLRKLLKRNTIFELFGFFITKAQANDLLLEFRATIKDSTSEHGIVKVINSKYGIYISVKKVAGVSFKMNLFNPQNPMICSYSKIWNVGVHYGTDRENFLVFNSEIKINEQLITVGNWSKRFSLESYVFKPEDYHHSDAEFFHVIDPNDPIPYFFVHDYSENEYRWDYSEQDHKNSLTT